MWRALVAMMVMLAVNAVATADDQAPLRFSVTYDKAITDSFSGRVYVMLSTRGMEPRFGPNWFNPDPFFALDVKDWKPGEALVFDDDCLAFPAAPSALPAGSYGVQAVMRRALDSPEIGTGAGTAYSVNSTRDLEGSSTGLVELSITKIAESREFPDRDGVREISLRSELLSAFHGRDITMRAAAIVPTGNPADGPAVYHITGFGSDHRFAFQLQRMMKGMELSAQTTHIVLDASCAGGHHVFADSANNGPVGSALVTEFIPHIEKELGLVSQPWARAVTGISSGGWSSLWLQVTYPDFFGGVWSIAPDPVDFRDFQRIDLYADGANMYTDSDGQRRPLARQTSAQGEERVMIWYDDFARMEWVMGHGGQLGSFEWVFSPRSSDGGPQRLFDRTTGAVNHDVATSWKKYDIRIILEEHWNTVGPKLAGKINVYMGDVDTFYLEGATKRLKKSLDALGSDAVIEIHPGKDHGSVITRELMQRIDAEWKRMFDEGKAANAAAQGKVAEPAGA